MAESRPIRCRSTAKKKEVEMLAFLSKDCFCHLISADINKGRREVRKLRMADPLRRRRLLPRGSGGRLHPARLLAGRGAVGVRDAWAAGPWRSGRGGTVGAVGPRIRVVTYPCPSHFCNGWQRLAINYWFAADRRHNRPVLRPRRSRPLLSRHPLPTWQCQAWQNTAEGGKQCPKSQ